MNQPNDAKTNGDTGTITTGSSVDHYEIRKKIGSGGMGQVFLAQDTRLGRDVALKFLDPQYISSEDFRARLIREARSAAKLSHANIVTVFDVSDGKDWLYLAMEYVDGRSLREMIDTRALTQDQALNVFEQICSGLRKAHTTGVIHRDLKPANIIVTPDFEAKILDFGLAKDTGDGKRTQSGAILGTANYMSPEQTQGRTLDVRSDIFSAGIVLYELLTGVNPFVRGFMPATIHAIAYEQAQPLEMYQSDLPAGFQTVVDKALAKNTADRYQNVDELLADVKRARQGEAITPANVSVIIQPKDQPAKGRSLAVLYLQNLGSADDDHLSYGITEDLIVDLSRLNAFRVVPMRKILKYKDSNLDLEVIAQQLNVTMLLDGSIHRGESSIRVSAQLVDASADRILWSNRWNEPHANLGKIVTGLAEGIAQALEVDSSTVRKADVKQGEVSNPEAYEHYLKGKFAFEKRSKKEDVETAIGHYQRALEISPTLLPAQIGIANVYIAQNQPEKALDVLRPALAEAERRGLRADEARIRTGIGLALNMTFEFPAAFPMFETAAQIFRDLGHASGELEAISGLIRVSLNLGKPEQALTYEDRINELIEAGAERRSVVEAKLFLAGAYRSERAYDRAMAILEDVLQIVRAESLVHREAHCLYEMHRITVYQIGADNAKALAYREEARLIAERLEDHVLLAKIVQAELGAQVESGEFRAALNGIPRALDLAKSIRDEIMFASLGSWRVAMLYVLGEYKQAMSAAEESERTSETLPAGKREMIVHSTYVISAQARFMMGEHKQALTEIERIYSASTDPYVLADTKFTEAEFHYLLGNNEKARTSCVEAMKHAEQARDPETIITSSAYAGILDVIEGKRSDGVERLREAVEKSEGHRTNVVARRLLGQALYQYGRTDAEKSEGRSTLMQAMGIARKQENAPEISHIQDVLKSV